MKKLSLTLAIVLYLLTVIGADAQEAGISKKEYKIGFSYGYGIQLGKRVDYKYKMHVFELKYYHPLLARKRFSLEALARPHYVLNTYKDSLKGDSYYEGYECGFNAGLLARKYSLKKTASIYTYLSTGPHYVSSTPKRQAEGFVFAHYLFAGSSLRLTNKTHLDVKAGLRHVSNASLKMPNGGINNFIANIGFFTVIK
ncbi:MAG: acyloxyacyl hydrolase [Bacteroidia bacterium]